MNIEYVVHNVEEQKFPALVMLNGVEIEADVPGLVIELVSVDGVMGHTIRQAIPNPEQLAEALAIFVPGAHVKSTFSAVE